ncbi:MAG: DHHA1 domain-containing protein, partial [Gammaproteobacteria bacterium]
LDVEEIATIERIVNREIRRNHAVEARLMPYRDALDAGAVALFGEKYGDEVRVLAMGDFSVELCGGTHVARTGDIGSFKVVSESGVASGVRRIEAITGEAAVAHAIEREQRLARLAQLVRAGGGDIEAKITQLLERGRALEKENQDLRNRLAGQSGRDVAAGASEIGGVTVVAECLEGADMNTLRAACDRLKDRFERAAVVLAAVEDDKVRIVAGVTKNATDRIHAGQLANHVAQQVGGKGGGRPDMAQAGGNDATRLADALASVSAWVAEHLD